jgi:hypothetical protein
LHRLPAHRNGAANNAVMDGPRPATFDEVESCHFTHADPLTLAAFNVPGDQISGCFVFQVRYDKSRKDQVAVIHKC